MNADIPAVNAMVSMESAQAELMARARIVQESEHCALVSCDGRILFDRIDSPIDVPGFDNSAMDGYALHLPAQVCVPGIFRVVQRIAAGHSGETLQPGSAARIFTGAPVPPNADVVVPQEAVEVVGESIRIDGPIVAGQHIRRRGEDIHTGQPVLARGTLLQARHLALAASIGVPQLIVHRRLKVGVFFTGDELVEPGDLLTDGAIYNSNRYGIGSLIRGLGCELTDYGVVRDNALATLAMLQKASAENDVIITSGGVSVGDEDHVKAAVMQLGQLDIWQVAIKPGKPFAFGRVGQADFIGLPGNPVAAFVTFFLLAAPFIRRRQGMNCCLPIKFEALSNFSWTAKGRKREFVRVREHIGQDMRLTLDLSSSNQGAGMVTSIAMADGLVDVGPNMQIVPGDRVVYYPMGGLMRV